MRKFLLASVATLGTGGLMGAAFAQVPAGTPTQGQTAYPLSNPTAFVNNNNNYQAPALPGALANPTPGTIVIYVNGKVQTTFQSEWGSADTRLFTAGTPVGSQVSIGSAAPAGSPGATALSITVPAGGFAPGSTVTIPNTPLATSLGTNGVGVVKLNPYALDSFMRIYFGADAMATIVGFAMARRSSCARISPAKSVATPARTPVDTVHCRRFTCAAPSPTLLARIGASSASAWPMA